MKGGVYLLHLHFKSNFTLKIGCSKNIKQRLKDHECIFYDGDLKCFGFIHSPLYCYDGKLILEKMIHHFFKEYKREKEIFEFPSSDNFYEVFIEKLLHYLKCHNIDAAFYSKLEDVPDTDVNTIKRNEKRISTTTKTEEKTSLCVPRDYQVPIIEKMLDFFENNERGSLFLPPGIGKTFITMFYLYRNFHMRKVLVLTPQILICEEFLMAFERIFTNSSKKCIVFNSDESNIADYGNCFEQKNFIFVATYQTFTKHKELFPNTYDMVIYDEAHHLATSQTFQSSFDTIGKKLFLTATPVIMDAQDEGEDFKVYSLDDEKVFGQCIHHISLNRAIDDGHLCDYRVLVYPNKEKNDKKQSEQSDDEFIENNDGEEHEKDSMQESDKEQSDDEFIDNFDEERKVCVQSIVNVQTYINTLIDVYGRKTIIVFYNSCEESKSACESVNIPNCVCYYVDGTSTKLQKKYIMNEMSTSERTPETKVRVLFNVNIMGEGVSINSIDCILFMDTRNSAKSIIQTIGRGLRLHSNKDCTIVCLPTFMGDMISNVGAALYCDGTYRQPQGIGDSVRDHITERVITATDNIEQRNIVVGNIAKTVKMIEITKNGGNRWKYMLDVVLGCEATNKKITQKTIYNGEKIGIWLHTQKSRYSGSKRLSRLTEYELESLSKSITWMYWLNNPRKTFEDWYHVLLTCEAENIKITQHTIFNGEKVGKWFASQTKKYNGTNKSSPLSEHELESLNKSTTWLHWVRKTKTFEDWYNILLTCEAENIKITQHTIFNGEKVGKWFDTQKQRYSSNKLSPLSEHELESLNKSTTWLHWVSKTKKTFEDWYSILRTCEAENKKIMSTTIVNGNKIGLWFTIQKRKYNGVKGNSQLTEQQLESLNSSISWQRWLSKKSKRRKIENKSI